jgi:hypothetical protein
MRAHAGPAALALALILPALALPSGAMAQNNDGQNDALAERPLVVQIAGPCVMGLDGQEADCRGVAYMAFPSSGRIDITALGAGMGLAFSGEADDNEDGSYTLTLDSVVSARTGRMDADGECEVDVAKDGRTVTNITCEAETDAGTLTLEAAGLIAASDIGDADKVTDEDDAVDDGLQA